MFGRPERLDFLVLLFGIALLGATTGCKSKGIDSLEVFGALDEFSFTNQFGEETTLSSLDDKILVLNFFFTRCAGPCPRLMTQMAEIRTRFADKDSLLLVSITSDPEHDSPDKLLAYQQRFIDDSAGWLLLSGEFEEIRRFAQESLKLGVSEDANLHSTRLVLVDKSNNVRGYYDGLNSESVNGLFGHLERLL